MTSKHDTARRRLCPVRTLGRVLALLMPAVLLTACAGDDRADDGSADRTSPAGLEMENGDEVSLDDGSRVRVYSPDKHEVWVQFRGEYGSWTSPELVHTEAGRWTHYRGIKTAGSTVAVTIDYWDMPELEDDYHPEFSVQVLCNRMHCEQPVVADGPSLTHLSDDGTSAWFMYREDTLSTWTWYGGASDLVLPDELGDDRLMVHMSDGTLAAVSGRAEGDECRYVLYVGEPGASELSEAAASEPRFGADACDIVDPEHEEGWIRVSTTTFERRSDGWVASER